MGIVTNGKCIIIVLRETERSELKNKIFGLYQGDIEISGVEFIEENKSIVVCIFISDHKKIGVNRFSFSADIKLCSLYRKMFTDGI